MNKQRLSKTVSNVLLAGVIFGTNGLVLVEKPFAESLNISVGKQSNNEETPRTGQSMQQIEQHFGQPIEKLAAIGEPPITRWRYANFTVYFEDDKVIHSVIHRS